MAAEYSKLQSRSFMRSNYSHIPGSAHSSNSNRLDEAEMFDIFRRNGYEMEASMVRDSLEKLASDRVILERQVQ